jgi:hypothetical protein
MRWLNPVRAWKGYRPVVSDHYQAVRSDAHREHHGVDVMFKRKSATDQSRWKAGTPNGSRLFFMPERVHVVAAEDGVLWNTKLSTGGHSVVVSHTGKGWATYYQHLSELFVPLGIARGAGGVKVSRGQSLGIVGGSPLDGQKLKHLHFEMWKGGGQESHVDPQLEGFDKWDYATDAGGGLELLILAGCAFAMVLMTRGVV